MRVLSAIIFADIQGYSALMQKNEKLASEYRDKFKHILENNIDQFDGKIVHFYGDGALIIFTSGLNAVEYSIKVQKELQKEPKVPVRIGIHMGDVVMENDGVFGDSVNVTSRIESIAVPGSIFVSDKIHDAISNHVHLQTKSLGRQSFKNVFKEIEIFAVIDSGIINPAGISKEGKLAKPERGIKLKYVLPVLLIISAIIAVIYFTSADKNIVRDKNNTLSSALIRNALTGYLESLYGARGPANDSSILLSDKFSFSGGDEKYNPYSPHYKTAVFNGIISDTMNNDVYNCIYSFNETNDSVITALNAQVTAGNKIQILNIRLNNVVHLTNKEPADKKVTVQKDKADSKDNDAVTKEDIRKLREKRLKKKILSKKLNQ